MNEWNENYDLTEQEEIALWKDCIFVFDSSALLNFYEYTQFSQKDIFENIFKKIGRRLWITSHVQAEFVKNRKATLKKPISLYQDLISRFNSAKTSLNEIKEKTKKDQKHPFIDQAVFSDFDAELEKFEKMFKKHIEAKINDINISSEDDLIFSTVKNSFEIGKEFSYEKILEIAEEGEFRYRNKIPPGYSDREKGGLQAFGDLIVWKQIIDLANETKKSIVLVNDDKKEDWWIRSGKEILGPRNELRREIRDLGVGFWMYTFPVFLDRAGKLLHVSVDSKTLDDVRYVSATALENKWDELLQRTDFIRLNGYQNAFCRHPEMEFMVGVMWNYRDYQLLITPINNPEIIIDEREVFNISKYSYLLLNPHIEPQRWLYAISIVDNKLKLDLLSGPKTPVKIIDQQY
jgi:hypothetical protein